MVGGIYLEQKSGIHVENLHSLDPTVHGKLDHQKDGLTVRKKILESVQ
jgi:hypothetical protein